MQFEIPAGSPLVQTAYLILPLTPTMAS